MTKADAGKKPIGTQLKRIAAFRLSRSGNLDYVSKVESPHRTLAIVLPPLHEFGRSIRKAVIEAVEKDGGWQLVELPFHEEQPPAQAGLESLDGLISWIGPGTEWLPRLAASGVPVVSCGSGYDDAEGVSELGTDIASILDLAVEHFASLGLAEVAFFGHWCDYAKTRDQWAESLQQKFRPHSIRLRTLRWEGPHPADDATVLMEERHIAELGQRFRELPTPIGVFCEDDYLAWLFANAVTAAERSVPRDFAVLGTGDMLVGRFSKPSISTIAMPGDKVGKAAFEEIKARVLRDQLGLDVGIGQVERDRPTQALDEGPATQHRLRPVGRVLAAHQDADAVEQAERDQPPQPRRQAGRQRAGSEDPQADQEDRPLAPHVRQASDDGKQRRGREQVGEDHPLHRGERGLEGDHQRGQRDVDAGEGDRGREGAQRRGRQDPAATSRIVNGVLETHRDRTPRAGGRRRCPRGARRRRALSLSRSPPASLG